jgi:23S rRNA pseudouridine1911/1915/1917 synthase
VTEQPPSAAALWLRSRVPPWADGLPLLDYLTRRFPYLDRPAWTAQMLIGALQCNGAMPPPTARVRTGDEVAYRRQVDEPYADTGVEVLFSDDDLVAAVKPAHLPSHADGPFVLHTFVQVLRQRTGRPDLCLVHRLDRETSGVMVAAASPLARRELERSFRSSAVAKVYLAVVHGTAAFERATVDAPIGRASGSAVTIRRAVVAADAADARPARTDFTVVARGQGRTLLRCEPRTGRTHQIRVHLEHLHHPLVGDRLYGKPDTVYLDFVAAMKRRVDPRQLPIDGVDRHLLHAAELRLPHPRHGGEVCFTAPSPPVLAAALAPAPG